MNNLSNNFNDEKDKPFIVCSECEKKPYIIELNIECIDCGNIQKMIVRLV